MLLAFRTTTVTSAVLASRAWRRAMLASANLGADLFGVVALATPGAQECRSKLGSAITDFVAMPGGGEKSCVAESEQVA